MTPLRKFAKSRGGKRIAIGKDKEGYKLVKITYNDNSCDFIPLTIKSYGAKVRELGVTKSARSGCLIATLRYERNTGEIVSSEKTTYILKRKRESFARVYFDKALDLFKKHEFNTASEFFKEGLDFVTCDCSIVGWRKRLNDSFYNIADQFDANLTYDKDYLFSLAFCLIYSEDKTLLKKGLSAINKYLQFEEDEYGYYVKGRIFSNLKEFENSLEVFEYAGTIWDNARLRYRVGRIKEQIFQENGIEDLFYALLDNPSSTCCARELIKCLKERFKELETIEDYRNNPLIRLFNEYRGEDILIAGYKTILRGKVLQKYSNRDDFDAIINEFLSVIRSNLKLDERSLKSARKEYKNRNDGVIPTKDFAADDVRYDSNVNPWVDVVGSGEEAEIAYWNTH